MRTLLPLLVLGTLLILAGEWQSRRRTAPSAPAAKPRLDLGEAHVDGDWDLLVLGRKLLALLRDPDPLRAQRATQAMLQMRRIDLAGIRRAADAAEPVDA